MEIGMPYIDMVMASKSECSLILLGLRELDRLQLLRIADQSDHATGVAHVGEHFDLSRSQGKKPGRKRAKMNRPRRSNRPLDQSAFSASWTLYLCHSVHPSCEACPRPESTFLPRPSRIHRFPPDPG